MKKMQQAAPEFTTDTDGQAVVHVALANSQRRATLYTENYQRLMEAGFSRFWKYTEDGRGSAYVTVNAYTRDGHCRMIPVARLIAQAGHGQRVRCSDGNTLNLRSENLSAYLGRAWFDASDWFPTVEALRAAGIEPVQKAQRTKLGRRRSQKLADAPLRSSDAHVVYTPRTVDRAALSARVREQMGHAGP
jgi:hypothetical protein